MKVALVSQYYPPDRPGRFAYELARDLTAAGHQVRVLTAFPNYTSEVTRFRAREEAEIMGNDGSDVTVRRVPIYAKHSANALGRILNYASFAMSARLNSRFLRDADVVYVYGSPATAVVPAYSWHRRRGTPFVYHVQDIWPESVTGSGFLPGPVARPIGRVISAYLRQVYRAAGAIIAIAPGARSVFVERGANPESVHVVYNWAREDGAVESRSTRSSGGDGLNLLYAGNLGRMQDLDVLIRAVAQLSDLDGVRLTLAGTGVMDGKLRALVRELGIEDVVEFRGYVEAEEMPRLYSSADFQVIPLKPLPVFTHTVPSKFQTGLAHGVPVITTVHGDVSRIVEQNQLGFTANPGDVDALAGVLREAYSTTSEEKRRYRARAAEFYDAHLSRQRAVRDIESMMRELVARSGSDDTSPTSD